MNRCICGEILVEQSHRSDLPPDEMLYRCANGHEMIFIRHPHVMTMLEEDREEALLALPNGLMSNLDDLRRKLFSLSAHEQTTLDEPTV
jgi:hypothetical protein